MTTLSLKRIWNSFFGNFRIIQIKIIKYFELFLRFSEKYNFYISYYKKMFVLLTYFVKLQFLFFFFIKNTTLQPNTTWCHQMQPKTNSYIFSKKNRKISCKYFQNIIKSLFFKKIITFFNNFCFFLILSILYHVRLFINHVSYNIFM